jgi:hypothetical protein
MWYPYGGNERLAVSCKAKDLPQDQSRHRVSVEGADFMRTAGMRLPTLYQPTTYNGREHTHCISIVGEVRLGGTMIAEKVWVGSETSGS